MDMTSTKNDTNNATVPDDMELAWQALEVARLIYAKAGTNPLELAEVYGSLAELSLEREHFDTAIGDYRAAIESMEQAKQQKLPMVQGERRLADLQFRICLALQLDGTQKLVDNTTDTGKALIKEGLHYCNKTFETLEGILAPLEANPSDANDAERKELKEIMGELKDKAAEMQDILINGVRLPLINESAPVPNAVRDMADEPVHDLGTFKRGAQAPAPEESAAKKLKQAADTISQVSQTPAAD